MTCIGGRRAVRILRGDCISIGYANTQRPLTRECQFCFFSPSVLDLPGPAAASSTTKAATTATSKWSGSIIAWFRIKCVGRIV